MLDQLQENNRWWFCPSGRSEGREASAMRCFFVVVVGFYFLIIASKNMGSSYQRGWQTAASEKSTGCRQHLAV